MSADTLLSPCFFSARQTKKQFLDLMKALGQVDPTLPSADAAVESVRKQALASEVPPNHKHAFDATMSILCDLRLQGWSLKLKSDAVALRRPETLIDANLERLRVQRMHAVGRNAQLIRGSVRSFVRNMERKRLGPSGFVSVFSLMRDGRELASKLRVVTSIQDEDARVGHLRSVVSPYLQLVEEGKKCEETGLMLGEIWRYFRHTWTNEYQSVPGRNLMLLVRDAAAQHHPVIGIAALASPVVQLSIRDEWIGWAPRHFVAAIQANPTIPWARWVDDKLSQLITEIYIKDISDRLLTKSSLKRPTEAVIAALEEESASARRRHRLHPGRSEHKSPVKQLADKDWEKRAQTNLFRSKRCMMLAKLLRSRLRLNHAGFQRDDRESLANALSTSEGRLAVETIRKCVKAIHIGNDVLDISVCGAVAPYSEILGGKLIAMMLTSPEVVQIYARRYGKADSIIASSMAGKRVSRRPRLAAMTTTSLYSSSLNQYTRIKVPAAALGKDSDESVRFKRLGKTRGQGTYQFSAVTVDLIEVLISQDEHNRSVNSIFGEGVSPRLRKIRFGLDKCGFESNYVLTHGSARNVYGIALVSDMQEVLTGKRKKPSYILPQKSPDTMSAQIAQYWCRRWLDRRIHDVEVLGRVESHTLVSPIEHGARVALPRIFEEEPLFYNLPD